MKLRNKETGEVGYFDLVVETNDDVYIYNSLDSLFDKWEEDKSEEPHN